MKTRSLLSTAALAIVALALTIPAVGQTSSSWKTTLHGADILNTGVAEYTSSAVLFSKFTVDTVTPDLATGRKLDVFVGPSKSANEPYGRLVGIITVERGIGTMVLSGAKLPQVREGTTVSIVEHEGASVTGSENLIMKGTF